MDTKARSYVFGHGAWFDWETEIWRWCDNNGSCHEEHRLCPECGEDALADGIDPCLGKLPGVKAACCGHGRDPVFGEHLGYILFEDGSRVDGTTEEILKIRDKILGK